jgi:anaerobic magnesium-protoporphyrin IX monomethyl ester cyclase
VHPPFGLEDLTGKTESMKEVMNIIPPLGLAYIASYLEADGHDVRIYDCQLDKTHQELLKELNQFNPEVVGLSTTTPTFPSTLETARGVKKTLPKSKTIIGGVHVTALPQETMSFECFDIGVLGEGEETMLDLINRLEKSGGTELHEVKGIAYRENGKLKINERRPFMKNLDLLPFPARHLLPPLSDYKPTPASYRKLPLAHLITTRGCPYQCTFCDRSIFGEKYRERSVENVMEEIEELIERYKVRELKFFDDTFSLNKKRVSAICREFKKRRLDIGWSCLTRVDSVTKEMLKEMKEAGCWQVLFGLESGDPRMLSLLKKGVTVKQNEEAVILAQSLGLSVRADFIVGTPGETRDSLERTLRFAIRLNMDFAHFNKFTPYPGTELYRMLINKGYDFDFITRSCSQLDHSYVMYTPDDMTSEELGSFVDRAYKRYYLRPEYILKQLSNIRSTTDINRMIRGFFAIYNL